MVNRERVRSRSEQKKLLSFLLELHRNDFKIIPIRPAAKIPVGGYSSRKWFRNSKEIADFISNNPNANFAMATGGPSGVVVIDVDGKSGKASWQQLIRKYGSPKRQVIVETPRGYHIYFAAPKARVRNSVKKIGKGIDVRGDGGYVLLPGSIGPDGARYRLRSGYPIDLGRCATPTWLKDLLTGKSIESRTSGIKQIQTTRYGWSALAAEAERIRRLRPGRRNDGLNRSSFRMGQLVSKGHLLESDAERALVRAGVATGLSAEETIAAVKSGISAGKRHVRIGSPKLRETVPRGDKTDDPLAEKLAGLGTQDVDNARRLFERFRKKLAYSVSQGWLVYGMGLWKRDEAAIEVMKAATVTVNKIANEIAFLNSDAELERRRALIRRAGSRSVIDAMIHLAKHHFLVDDRKLDRDKMLLNVKNGTIDLRTGVLRPHRAQDYITRIVSIDYDPAAKCPRFIQFLDFLTRGDKEYRKYIWRLFGYILTSDTSLQEFYILIGPGGTGKSLLGKVMRESIGEYGIQAGMNSFLIRPYDNNIPSDIARMRGARLVVAAEANFDRQIDEAKIKAMTGEDPLVARFMRQNEFQFMPEFKLVLIANEFPRVRVKDDAFWRRARVLPVDRPVPRDQVDPKLGLKLQAEYPGILAWAVRGCLSWRKFRMQMPDAVLQGTKRWQTFAEVIKRFVSDVCVLEPTAKITASDLYAAYENWCSENKERPMATSGFKIKMMELDLNQRHTRKANVWTGIRLRATS